MSGINGIFVTGTDTEVGKTHISAGLLHWLGQRGVRAAGYKPVAAGMGPNAEGVWTNEDGALLQRHSPVPVSVAQVGPCQVRTACAPHIAAALEQRPIDRAALLQGAQALAAQADVLVVEGAGGLCIPLGPDWDSADLMADLALPVVLVVGLRLGCLNHAILTAEAVAARGLRLVGWVGNTINPAMPHLSDNVRTLTDDLQRRHQVPCWGIVPHLTPPDAASIARFFHADVLQAHFGPLHAQAVSSV